MLIQGDKVMSKKEKWSAFGKNAGGAFKKFGKAVATTAKVAVGKEENEVDEDGKSKLKSAWGDTGKGFGDAGKSLGKAAKGTFKEDAPKDKKKGTEKEGAIDVESKEK